MFPGINANHKRAHTIAVNNEGTKAYVANTKANYMSVIDLNEEVEKSRVEVGYGGRAIAISPDDKFGFITIENTNEVAVIDLHGEIVVTKVGVGFSPRGIVLDKSSMLVYIADFDRSSGPSGRTGGLSMKNSLTVLEAKKSS